MPRLLARSLASCAGPRLHLPVGSSYQHFITEEGDAGVAEDCRASGATARARRLRGSFSYMLISKTTFLEFQMCPKNTWLKLHRPELLHQFKLSEFELHLVEQGNEVEAFARNLWPGGVLVASGGEEGCRETERLMALGRAGDLSGDVRSRWLYREVRRARSRPGSRNVGHLRDQGHELEEGRERGPRSHLRSDIPSDRARPARRGVDAARSRDRRRRTLDRSRRDDRRRQRLRTVHRAGHHGCVHRRLSGLDGRAPDPCGHAAHQQRGRRVELRDARARPAESHLRPGQARGRGFPHPQGARRRGDCHARRGRTRALRRPTS